MTKQKASKTVKQLIQLENAAERILKIERVAARLIKKYYS